MAQAPNQAPKTVAAPVAWVEEPTDDDDDDDDEVRVPDDGDTSGIRELMQQRRSSRPSRGPRDRGR